MWIAVYGAEASNLALKDHGDRWNFPGRRHHSEDSGQAGTVPCSCRLFYEKGRLRPLVEAVPVQVVTNEKAGLLGAARCAAVRGKG